MRTKYEHWIAAVLLVLTGCTAIGPPTVTRDRVQYTSAISESWKSQMLLNLVKLRYGDAPVFLDVSSVINSYELSGTATVGGDWTFNPAYGSSATVRAQGFYADRPTVTYSPLTGEKFSKSMLTPIPPSSIFFFIQAGYDASTVLRVLVQSVNGIRNQYGGTGRTRAADPEFYLLADRMRALQDSGAYEIRVLKSTEQEALAAVFSDKVDPETEGNIAAIRKMLGLDPKAREFRVIYGSIASSDKEIAILSRSVLQVIVNLAAGIEVPETHVAEQRVAMIPSDASNGSPAAPLMRVRSSSERPQNAFVTVPYRDYWFWIDDRDLRSKTLFSFLMFILNLVDTGVKEGAPVVTIPTR